MRSGLMAGLLVLAVAGAACQGKEFADGFRTSDTFVRDQWEQREPWPVDVLWVVDTSCSMMDEQEALAANFPAFTEFFEETNLSFRLGVTSTNIDEEGTLGLDGALNGPWLDDSTEELHDAWIEQALMGIDPGHSREKGLHAAWTALGVRTDGPNGTFIRDDAGLAIVIVSDEPDYSTLDASGSADVIDQAEFSEWLDGYKGDVERSRLSGIVGIGPDGIDDPRGCNLDENGQQQQGQGAQRGDGYLEAVAATGGVSQSICSDDWVEMLRLLGLLTAGLQDRYPLSKLARPATLQVEVDGYAVTGWEYVLATNEVVFTTSSSLPRPGDRVEVEYEERLDP